MHDTKEEFSEENVLVNLVEGSLIQRWSGEIRCKRGHYGCVLKAQKPHNVVAGSVGSPRVIASGKR